jgi:hypothetical protein
MAFSVALPQQNLAEIEQELALVSNPRHERYGNWWSLSKVVARTAPLPQHRAEVRAWLATESVKCIDLPASLRCVARVASVEALLQTRVSHFVDSRTGDALLRVHPDDPVIIPAHLDGIVSFITQASGELGVCRVLLLVLGGWLGGGGGCGGNSLTRCDASAAL